MIKKLLRVARNGDSFGVEMRRMGLWTVAFGGALYVSSGSWILPVLLIPVAIHAAWWRSRP